MAPHSGWACTLCGDGETSGRFSLIGKCEFDSNCTIMNF